MKAAGQVVHIVRKDARHLWPEIAASFVVLGMFAWMTWRNTWAQEFQGIGAIGLLLYVLLPLSWAVLIGRLVQDEALVGDRQFWLTRPYRWYSLLGAKVLFVVVFVALPMLAMQAGVLAWCGFHPVALAGALLGNVGWLAVFFFLPMLAMAAVTSGFARMALFLVGGILLLVAISEMTTGLFNRMDHVGLSMLRVWLGVAFGAAVGAGIAVAMVQYAGRRSWAARAILVMVSIALGVLLTTAERTMRYQEAGPRIQKMASMGMALDGAGHWTGVVHQSATGYDLSIPVRIGGLREGLVLETRKLQVEVKGPNGLLWQSPGQLDSGGLRNGPVTVHVPVAGSMLDRVTGAQVEVDVSMELRGAPVRWPMTSVAREAGFVVPDGGICRRAAGARGDVMFPWLCRYALNAPQGTDFLAPVAKDCQLGGTRPADDGVAEVGGFSDRRSLPFFFSPVFVKSLWFNWQGEEGLHPSGESPPENLCDGSRVEFRNHSDFNESLSASVRGVILWEGGR
jgi:hypothetical protein